MAPTSTRTLVRQSPWGHSRQILSSRIIDQPVRATCRDAGKLFNLYIEFTESTFRSPLFSNALRSFWIYDRAMQVHPAGLPKDLLLFSKGLQISCPAPIVSYESQRAQMLSQNTLCQSSSDQNDENFHRTSWSPGLMGCWQRVPTK